MFQFTSFYGLMMHKWRRGRRTGSGRGMFTTVLGALYKSTFTLLKFTYLY